MKTHISYRIFTVVFSLGLILVLAVGNAQASPMSPMEADFTDIDTYVAEQMNDLGIPGMALGIIQDGQILHLQGFGIADSTGRPVTPQTPFYIGSVTKSFTALAVMQLVEAGKIELDAPVQTYLPWFELADREASALITVRNLLNQTTGISTRDGMRFWTSQKGVEETVRELNNIQLTQPVGKTYQYCNLNFIIAGLIVEVISGQSYSDYVTEYILKPLNMRHSYLSSSSALADGLSEGHTYMFGRAFRSETVIPPSILPAGGLIVGVEDLTHYAIAQLNDGRYGDTSILSPQGIAELHSPAIPTGGDKYYAMGWIVGMWDGIRLIFHNGDPSRFRSVVILMPDRDSGIILLANATGFEQGKSEVVEQIAIGVLNLMNGKAAAQVTVSFLMHFLYWAILMTPLLMILSIVLVWRKRQNMKGWGVILTVLLTLGLIYFMFKISLTTITLPSLIVWNPELGYTLIAVAVIGIGWSTVLSAMRLTSWKSNIHNNSQDGKFEQYFESSS